MANIVIDNAINANSSVGNTDCDNNVISSWDNKRNHNAINDKNNVSKPTRGMLILIVQ